MSAQNHTSAPHEAPTAWPGGVLHHVTFNYSPRTAAGIGWDGAFREYLSRLGLLSKGLELAGRSLDGRVVSIYAKAWRDRGHEEVSARHAKYKAARADLMTAETTDPENIAGKVRLLAEMLGLADPWKLWTEQQGAEGLTPEAAALAVIYRDLRALARERSQPKKGGKRAKRKG